MLPRLNITRSRLATALLIAGGLLIQSASLAFAAIINPVTGNLGNDAAGAASGAAFTKYFVAIWRVGINVGALLVLVQFASGSIDWMNSGGDKAKLESARGKMTQAAIGIIILVSSFTIIGFFSNMVFGNDFNLLKLTFPSASSAGASSTTGSTITPTP